LPEEFGRFGELRRIILTRNPTLNNAALARRRIQNKPYLQVFVVDRTVQEYLDALEIRRNAVTPRSSVFRFHPSDDMSIPLTQHFDQVYVINLADRIDRRRNVEREFREIGVEIPNPKVTFFPGIRPNERRDFPSKGARGCFLSHLGVLRMAEQSGFRRILICEDDLAFVENFDVCWEQALSELSRHEWSLFYGGYRMHWKIDHSAPMLVRPIESAAIIETAHFLAFQGESIGAAAQYLAAMLERPGGDPNGGPMHVDGAYNWFRRNNPQYVTMLAVPELGYQESFRSDITPASVFDEPAFSIVGAGLRSLKSKLDLVFARKS
jgi:hypothetical protein